MHKTAIILVNYKDYANRFLTECRDSLRAQNYDKNLYKAYIVDNATSQESKKYIKNNYPEAKIIERQDGNYAAANNAGIKQAIKDGCKYFIIANMDTKFDRNWLKELIHAINSDSKIGIVQSKILLYPKNNKGEWKTPNESYNLDQKNKINSIGNMLHFLGFGYSRGDGKKDYKIKGLPEIKGYASGCSFIIKKEVIEKIGGYNEEYFMYHDDIEVSTKTRLAGYKIVLAPKSICYHKYEFGRNNLAFYHMERNRYIFIFSFYKLPTILLILPTLIIMDLGLLFYSIINKWSKAKFNVYKYFLKFENWNKIKQSRKELKKIRKKSKIKDKNIVQNFTGKILFQEIENPILKHVVNPIFNIYWKVVSKIIIW